MMSERPDLDAIERQLEIEGVPYVNQGWAPAEHQRAVDLLTYCRKMEAENKRLRDQIIDQAAM